MNQVEQSQLKVSDMAEGKEYVFTDWFFFGRSNEKTIIKKEGKIYYVTYSGGDFETDQTVEFAYDSLVLIDYNVKESELTLSDLEEASGELYTLFMSNELDDDMKFKVTVRSVHSNEIPENQDVPYQMISMARILSELARYGEKKIIVPDAQSMEVIRTVLNTFDINYHVKQVDDKEFYITMKGSLLDIKDN